MLSDGEVLDLAEALGRDPAFLDRKRIGDAFNAEEVLAARRLLIQSATRVRDLMDGAAEGGEAETLDLARAIAQHEMIQGKVAQATAEWGRAGRSFRALMEGQPEAEQLADFLRENSGRTLWQIQQLARYGRRSQTPGQVSQLIADTTAGKIQRAIIWYWVNTLISGPVTHARYAVGNAVSALWTAGIETPLAAGFGAARQVFGIGDAADRVYLGEAMAQVYGLAKGSRDGWGAGYEAFKANQSPPLPGERVPQQFLAGPPLAPIPGPIGTAIGVPGRSVAAIHSFFKSLRYEQNIQALAYRQAMTESLDGDAFNARVAELTAHPTEEMMQSATPEALKEIYMAPADYHSVMGKLVRAVNSNLVAKIMMPFLKIGSQITRNAFVERTPLGLFSGDVRGRLFSGTAQGDIQAAKITAGVGLAAAASLATIEGLLTGDGPADPAQRAVWLLNHRPNSIVVGDVTIPYQGLGSLGMLMRFAANMTETARGWDEKDGATLAVSFLEGFTRSVLDENFMRGAKDMLDAVYHPQEYGLQYLKNFATNWLPFSIGMGQVARVIDPYSRLQRSILEAAEARVPLLSMTLLPRRDRFGEPVRSTTGLPQIDETRYQGDATVRAMEELHLGIGPIGKKLRGVELSEDQFDDRARISGRLTKMALDRLVALPRWGEMAAETRIDLMHRAIRGSRAQADTMLLMQHPDIVRAAIAAKTTRLTGAATP